jgi:hypothetical protein
VVELASRFRQLTASSSSRRLTAFLLAFEPESGRDSETGVGASQLLRSERLATATISVREPVRQIEEHLN